MSKQPKSKKFIDPARLLVKTLENLGVEFIFGIPGDTKGKKDVSETFIFRELKKSTINFIRTTHEQSGGYMADIYYRLTGKVGVCYTTLGPGATNISTALANAYLDRSAVVCISSQIPQESWHMDSHQYLDMSKEFENKTKLRLTIHSASEIPSILSEAFRVASDERPGPVHIELPVDILEEGATLEAGQIKKTKTKKPEIVNTDFLVSEVNNAKFPLLLIGPAVLRQNAYWEIKEFMEKFNIYAMTTFQGKTSVDHRHPLYLGTLSRHLPSTTEILAECDLLINVGYDFAEGIKPKAWEDSGKKKVINLDTALKTGGSFYQPDIDGVYDLKLLFKNLLGSEITPKKYKNPPKSHFKRSKFSFDKNSFPINPLYFVEQLRKILKEDDLVLVDVGEHKQVMGLFFDSYSPKSMVFSNGHSTLGYALPASIAAALTQKNRRIVVVVGDGGFQMSCGEFITAVNNNLPIKVLVLNDGSYGIIKYEQNKAFGENYAVEFNNPDFVRLAQSFGALGLRVNSPRGLRRILNKALNSSRAVIVDIPVSYRNKLW